jgi:plasmid maintenance system antidote protein VapI
MKKTFNEQIKILNSLTVNDIVEVIGVKRDMAHKIKTGRNLPSLKRAVILEKSFGIDCSFWVLNQKQKESKDEK